MVRPCSIAETLATCELFAPLSAGEIACIEGLCQLQFYQTGDMIFSQGDQCNKIYVVSDGQVLLERTLDLGTRKAKVPIAILGPGRALGCWAAILGQCHVLMCSAICQRPTQVISMDASDLRAALLKDLAMGFKVMERLVLLLRERIQGAYGAMENL